MEKPTTEDVLNSIANHENNVKYRTEENAIALLLNKYPNNNNINEIIIKAGTINSLYNTHIYDIYSASMVIKESNFDELVRAGNIEAVEKIATVRNNDKERRNYSFATKYCHRHNPNDFPIYDKYVDYMLWLYNDIFNFALFTRDDLKTYGILKDIINRFRQEFGLENFGYDKIDVFLWSKGKEYFPKPKK